MLVTVVTGDDVALPVTLKKDGATFSISGGATVKAAIVSTDHESKYTADVVQSSLASGADWDNSLIIVEFSAALTDALTVTGRTLIEIEVEDAGKKLTWFVTISIVKGNIS